MSSSIRMLAFFAWAAGSLCAPAPAAFAQTPSGERDLTGLSLEDLMNTPVYAASRYEQNVSEAPASVSIVSAAEIHAYGYRTLGDVIASVPGFYSTYDRSYAYAGVRGFSRPGDFNSRVLLLIDGVRTNEIIYDSSGFGTDFNLDVDLIDRVEVVRGPGSVLYGTNAFFAVVNVITKTGRDMEGGEIAGAAETAKSYGGRASYGGALGETGDYLVSVSSLASQGADLYFPEFDAPETNDGIAEGRDGLRFGNVFAALHRDEWKLEVTYLNRDKPRPTATYGTIFNNPLDRDGDARFIADLSYDRSLGDGYDANAHVTYEKYAYEGDYLFDYAEEGAPAAPALNMDRVGAQWWGVEARVCGEVLPRNRATAGAEYHDNFDITQRNFDDGTSPYLDSHEHTSFIGVYAQDEIRVSSAVILNLGARYDHTAPFSEGEASPRAALILKPADGTTLKLLYGEAFRSPNAFELYYNDGNYTTKANPSLSPERIRTLEAVVEQRISSTVGGTLSAYRYEIHDLITQRVDPDDGLLQYWNADAAEANGIELAVTGQVPAVLEGRLSYSYVDALYTATEARLTNSPQHLAKLNLMTAPIAGTVRAALEVQHIGDRLTLQGKTAERFTVANVNLTSVGLPGGLSAAVGVYNLFDERYVYPAAGEFVQDALEADGRTYRVKCIWSF